MISIVLVRKARANCIETTGRNTSYMGGGTRIIGQGQGNWKGDEVNVADVDKELGAIEGKFTEIPESVQNQSAHALSPYG